MHIVDFVYEQRRFSTQAFGPGPRTMGITKHIEKEIAEIRAAPTDLMEWVDVILLAIDGAWRAGHTSQNIERAMRNKLEINKARTWPDWRSTSEDEPIQHSSPDGGLTPDDPSRTV